MTEATFTLTGYEARTHQLFADAKIQFEGWAFPNIAMVFKAQHTSALTKQRICEIISAAQGGLRVDTCIVKNTLAKLVRMKVLRTRVERGVRLYEVNY